MKSKSRCQKTRFKLRSLLHGTTWTYLSSNHRNSRSSYRMNIESFKCHFNLWLNTWQWTLSLPHVLSFCWRLVLYCQTFFCFILISHEKYIIETFAEIAQLFSVCCRHYAARNLTFRSLDTFLLTPSIGSLHRLILHYRRVTWHGRRKESKIKKGTRAKDTDKRIRVDIKQYSIAIVCLLFCKCVMCVCVCVCGYPLNFDLAWKMKKKKTLLLPIFVWWRLNLREICHLSKTFDFSHVSHYILSLFSAFARLSAHLETYGVHFFPALMPFIVPFVFYSFCTAWCALTHSQVTQIRLREYTKRDRANGGEACFFLIWFFFFTSRNVSSHRYS